jgi:hypothetical protein
VPTFTATDAASTSARTRSNCIPGPTDRGPEMQADDGDDRSLRLSQAFNARETDAVLEQMPGDIWERRRQLAVP